MSSSFFALIDDIAVLARAAAASIDDVVAGAAQASAKATGVVIDDAAVTPQYVRGISPTRELPIVWRIARGSLVNKAIIIATILPLSIFLPKALPWLLVIGGTYLAYEGAEKVWHWWSTRHRSAQAEQESVLDRSDTDENQIVRAALRTDVVLSAEIMLISLASIDADTWVLQLAILVVVAIVMTVGVYGVVGVLIKFDDVGAWLMKKPGRFARHFGVGLVRAMPKVFAALTIVGVVAMLWIGGQIVIENVSLIGWHAPLEAFDSLADLVPGPGVLPWTVTTAVFAVAGWCWGSIIFGLTRIRIRGRR